MALGCMQMESHLEAYTVWYPPLRSSLLCLSKLYGCVDPKIFNGMAQDAVHAATAAVQVSVPFPRPQQLCLCLTSLVCIPDQDVAAESILSNKAYAPYMT